MKQSRRAPSSKSRFGRYASIYTLCFLLFISLSGQVYVAAEEDSTKETQNETVQEEAPKKEEKVEFPEKQW